MEAQPNSEDLFMRSHLAAAPAAPGDGAHCSRLGPPKTLHASQQPTHRCHTNDSHATASGQHH